MIGSTLGHYRVVEKLGGGGMGDVYLAEDLRLHRRVALKVLPAAVAADAERLERFAREAKAVGALNHPNIVTIHAIEEAGGLPVLVMELVEGRTLGEVVPSGGLSEEGFFDLAIPLADALSAAHERGVTHRDLKPSNVMITTDGRVKVVDFGLAKLRQEAQAQEQTALMDQQLTEEGRILGTYPYMSPEQIKGRPVDHRSDIFSLGVVLYEMATGERPFSGETSADLVSSILRDSPPPVHRLNRKLPRHLDRILDHCLEKDPDRRFQTAKDLRNELQSLHRETQAERLIRSTSIGRRLVHGATRGSRLWLTAAGLALASLLAVAAFVTWRSAPEAGFRAARTPAASAGGGAAETEQPRQSVAVLFFQNLTGDPEVDWLRTGLTEMLVTDLSQSPSLRILSTDRLYQVLQDLEGLERSVVSADLVREVAERTGVGMILLGSYIKAGETLQVNTTLQDAETGEILDAQRIHGTGESSIFSTVDRLSDGVLASLQRFGRLAEGPGPRAEEGIESVTTSSVEAYRFYVEGMRLSHQFKIEEAIPLFERAIERDPGFAMAHARLARIYETLGREERLAEALNQAFTRSDRLPVRERYYVEGTYYGRKRATYDRAIEALQEAVSLYPDHHLARYQLGVLYLSFELHDRAAVQFEEALRRGYDYVGVYNALATVYEATGDGDRARELLEDWAESRPESWSVELVRGWHAVNRGDLRELESLLERMEELRSGSPFNDHTRWRMSVLQGSWDDAADAARELAETGDPYWRWRGTTGQAVLALYRGRPTDAMEHLQASTGAYENEQALTGVGRNWAAWLLLDLGRPAEALEQSEASRRLAPDEWPGWEALFLSALAHQRLGRPAEADRLAAELAGIAERLPGNVEERLHHRLLGLLEMERGQRTAALGELERAGAMLPPRGLPWHRHRVPDHGAIWYELATLYQALGRSADALEHYRRVVESGTERTFHPLEYVRSHYFLGRLLEKRGDRGGARAAYRAFLGFWEDGDIDRERVEDARARLARLGG